MFRASIHRTCFSSREADFAFKNIWNSPESNYGDLSFLSTLRALAGARGKTNSKVSVLTNLVHGSMNVNDIMSRFVQEDTLTILGHNPDALWLQPLINNLQEDGYIEVEKVRKFFIKVMDVRAYVNKATRSSVVLVELLDMPKFHYLQCGIYTYLPWIFEDVAEGVSEQEMALIRSLREKSPDAYLEALDSLYRSSCKTIYEAYVKANLSGWESSRDRRELQSTETTIMECRRAIQSHNEQISNYLRQIRELQIRQAGLQLRIGKAEEGSEIMDFFISSPNVKFEFTQGDDIWFIAKSDVIYFDEESAAATIENAGSVLYARLRNLTKAGMKALMKAIFVDQSVKLQFCAAYRFSAGTSMRGVRHYEFPPEFSNWMPNTHIQEYGCVGGNDRVVNAALEQNNDALALSQCVSSCGSLNFNDITVLTRFAEDIDAGYNSLRVLRLPDGTMATPQEVLQMLSEQKEEENNGESN